MRTHPSLPLIAAALLLLVGCAQADDGGGTEGTTGSRLFGDCHSGDPVLQGAATLAEPDLDADGDPDPVRHVPVTDTGPCANALLLTVEGTPVAVRLGVRGLDRDSVRVVQLPGTARELLMLRERPHPRGGFVLHLFGVAGGRLGEITVDDRPVVGFVATDGGAAPATATCTDPDSDPDSGVIATLTSTAHQPPGVVLAWDVERTVYALRGNRAEPVRSERVRTAAADPLLRREMPRLYDPDSYFADCAVDPSS